MHRTRSYLELEQRSKLFLAVLLNILDNGKKVIKDAHSEFIYFNKDKTHWSIKIMKFLNLLCFQYALHFAFHPKRYGYYRLFWYPWIKILRKVVAAFLLWKEFNIPFRLALIIVKFLFEWDLGSSIAYSPLNTKAHRQPDVLWSTKRRQTTVIFGKLCIWVQLRLRISKQVHRIETSAFE